MKNDRRFLCTTMEQYVDVTDITKTNPW